MSAKSRGDLPAYDARDSDRPTGAGEIPLALVPGAAKTDPAMTMKVPIPGYVKSWRS